MMDLSPKTIREIFERRILELTRKALLSREETFDFQLSGGWLR